MNRHPSVLLEALEGRRLLSATTLASDQQNLNDSVQKLASDKAAATATLAQDRSAVRGIKATPDPSLPPLIQTLKNDVVAKANTLLAEHAMITATIKADNLAIAQDQSRARLDHKDPAQFAIDNAQTSMDRGKLFNDRADLHLTLFNDVLNASLLIMHDRNAIIHERKAYGVNPNLAGAQQKIVDDSILFRVMIIADQRAIAMDQAIVAQEKSATLKSCIPALWIKTPRCREFAEPNRGPRSHGR